jgi:hypothetical protein
MLQANLVSQGCADPNIFFPFALANKLAMLPGMKNVPTGAL